MAESLALLNEKEQEQAGMLGGILDAFYSISHTLKTVPVEAVIDRNIMAGLLNSTAVEYLKAETAFWQLVRRHHELPESRLATDGLNVYLANEGEKSI